jgi:putative signal transducing protein
VSNRSDANLHEYKRRLAGTYAAMTDGELLKLARDSDSLTESAWDALEDELDRRHLDPPDAPVQVRTTVDLRMLVPIRRFRDLPEALLAKGSLESAGIECFLRDENIVRLDWFISNFIGGVKLCVWPEDVDKAQTLLDEPMLEGFYVQGVGLYEQPRCPQCRSLDVSFQELTPPSLTRASAKIGSANHRAGWQCLACSTSWEEDEGPEPVGSST